MEIISKVVVWIMMVGVVVGGIASIVKPKSELANQFLEGINSIGAIFLPVAGIMASLPLLSRGIELVISPLFKLLGADAAIATNTFIAVDMGGYQLAQAVALTKESWIMSTTIGYMAGATIVFSLPIALKMIPEKYHSQLSLGVMSGFISIPIGVFFSNLIILITNPMIRETISTSGPLAYQLQMSFSSLLVNIIPLVIICLALAAGLYFKPKSMISGFKKFGIVIDSFIKIVFIMAVVEYFLGIFSTTFGNWPFDPIIADELDINRALEVAGYIGLMLCGAFPIVYLLQKYLNKPLEKLGSKLGLSSKIMSGILAASANVIALFAMIENMDDEEIVITIAFSVCGAFIIGDHLAFTANFQPQLIVPVFVGKLIGGVVAILIAKYLYRKSFKTSK